MRCIMQSINIKINDDETNINLIIMNKNEYDKLKKENEDMNKLIVELIKDKEFIYGKSNIQENVCMLRK